MRGNVGKAGFRLAIVLLIPWALYWGYTYYAADRWIGDGLAAQCRTTRGCDPNASATETDLVALTIENQYAQEQIDARNRALWLGPGVPIGLALLVAGGIWAWRGYPPTKPNDPNK
jgi:hypothetical protein